MSRGVGVLTVTSLRAHCTITPDGHWLWNGALSEEGIPRVHTYDHERNEKRTMSGPKAAWNIAYQEAPPVWAPLVYRGCMIRRCLCPAHLRAARDKAEIGAHMRRMGILRADYRSEVMA